MEQTSEKPQSHTTDEILSEQLTDTRGLAAYVQRAEFTFRDTRSPAVDLLRSLAEELRLISGHIEALVSTAGEPGKGSMRTFREPPIKNEADGLEEVLMQFCRYTRKTSERRQMAKRASDREAIVLFNRILTMAHRSLWFLDVYSNAIWLRGRLSRLPKWNGVSAEPRHVLARRAGLEGVGLKV